MQQILIALIALMFAAPALAESGRTDLITACQGSDFKLDCACVGETYDAQAAGLDPVAAKALANLGASVLGGPSFEEQRPEVLMQIVERIEPMVILPETCKSGTAASAEGREAIRADITQRCKGSILPIDCACVGDAFDRAAGDFDATGQAMMQSVMLEVLGVDAARDLSDWPDAEALQYAEAFEAPGHFIDACAVPDEAAIAIGLQAAGRPAPSLADRAAASPAEAISMECQSFGISPENCTCEIAMLERQLSPQAFRLRGESARLEAMAALERRAGADPPAEAIAALGLDLAEGKALLGEANSVMSDELLSEQRRLACLTLQ